MPYGTWHKDIATKVTGTDGEYVSIRSSLKTHDPALPN
jgi:hypothetical protein